MGKLIMIQKTLLVVFAVAAVFLGGAGCCQKYYDQCKIYMDQAKASAHRAAASVVKAEANAQDAKVPVPRASTAANRAEAAAARAEDAGEKMCAKVKYMKAKKSKKAIAIELKHDVRFDLRQFGDEKNLSYGMYTYVLFGLRVDDLSTTNPDVAERYKELLSAIEGIPTIPEAKKAPNFSPEESNLFCIPSKKKHDGNKFTLDDYNSELAKSYIVQLCSIIEDKNLVQRFNSKPGPFLISTPYPLHESIQAGFPFLYADLSESKTPAIKEIIYAYRNYAITEKIDKVEKFYRLRLILLNWILIAEENLKIAQAAAGEIPKKYMIK